MALTVDGMSSYGGTSFYAAPSVKWYFRDPTLMAVSPDGTWIRIEHRKDVARLQKEQPE
jgi:hypothetical protein